MAAAAPLATVDAAVPEGLVLGLRAIVDGLLGVGGNEATEEEIAAADSPRLRRRIPKPPIIRASRPQRRQPDGHRQSGQ